MHFCHMTDAYKYLDRLRIYRHGQNFDSIKRFHSHVAQLRINEKVNHTTIDRFTSGLNYRFASKRTNLFVAITRL